MKTQRAAVFALKIITLLFAPGALLFAFVLPIGLGVRGIGGHLLIALPMMIFIGWGLWKFLSGRLSKAASPMSFYPALIGCGLIWIIAAGLPLTLYLNGVTLGEIAQNGLPIISNAADIYARPAALSAFSRSRRNDVLYDYLHVCAGYLLPLPKTDKTYRFLDYQVKIYDATTMRSLIEDVFIDQTYFFKAATSEPFIVDCGSHIGMSVLYFKNLYPKAKILAFEPARETFRFLKANVEGNNLQDVFLFQKALAGRNGRLTFYGDLSQASSLFKNRSKITQGAARYEVDAVTLSSFIDRPVDFLKIDTEGAEIEIIEDLAVSNKLDWVAQMVLEYHQEDSAPESSLAALLKHLEDHHFEYWVYPELDRSLQKSGPRAIHLYARRK